MKKSALFLAFNIMVTFSAFATIRTVCNSPTTTIAQFSTIQAAIDASISGDTVLVHGSPINYNGFSVSNKQLTIIGPGWSPNKATTFRAVIVTSCSFSGTGTSNSNIQGLVFASTININSSRPSNMLFLRNEFAFLDIQLNEGNVVYTGYRFESNVFNEARIIGTPTSNYNNLVFQNNIFYKTGVNSNSIRGLNSVANNIIFDHNLWYGYSTFCFIDCGFLLITNNIFVGRNAALNNTNSTFNNNITFITSNDTPWASSNGNFDAGGNVAGQNPLMVDQSAVNAPTINPILNFTIASGPANNAGSDGKDMGLLYDTTGSLNWTNSRNSRLPRIFSMSITNPTIPSGGTLNVNVEARKSN